MKTICLNQTVKSCPGSVATIGVFDGVHLGHQLVIGRVLETARQQGLASTVITFDRSPRQVISWWYYHSLANWHRCQPMISCSRYWLNN